MLKLDQITVQVEGQTVVNQLSLTVRPGQITVLMGPNGSGKTSLLLALAGHPHYQLKGRVTLDGQRIDQLAPEKRARQGLFLGFQTPIAIPGLDPVAFLWEALQQQGQSATLEAIRNQMQHQLKQLALKETVLDHGLNQGLSGGERKKLELLQALILKPKYALLDEPDSGLDIESLQLVAQAIKRLSRQGTGCLVVTHYPRMARQLQPNQVFIIRAGRIVAQGQQELIDQIEAQGYQDLSP